ncbi:30S ribosomal protein S18 [Candidatus Haliotispira prima]|uniref:Small ribosomal subunit protein bS18 n=1 Tax=Candidatus Haliotispira prima TaxID=3034016 RepID=A0ABY8MEX1_9SPIO|nr:30S ribosomal protein S18 [Candidatus Haliotispira prima]
MSTENEVTEKKPEQSSGNQSENSRENYRENREGGGSGPRPERRFNNNRRRFQSRRKVCRFCKNTMTMNYRDPESMKRFITERGKILPRRITGTCAKHQRQLALTIKRARVLALLPFVAK